MTIGPELTLLQCAAFVAMFRQMTGARAADLDLTALRPQRPDHTGEDAITEIFAELTVRPPPAGGAEMSRRFCRMAATPRGSIATARHHVAYGAQEPHDFKFAEAMFENYAQCRTPLPPGAHDFLSAGMAYFKAPARRPAALIQEARELFAS